MSKLQHHFDLNHYGIWQFEMSRAIWFNSADIMSLDIFIAHSLHTHTHTHTNLSVHYVRLLRWEPRRWPETAQWHSGERGGRHDDLPTGVESPHHRWDRTHAQGRRQLHHWRLLHLSLYALPKSFHTMPQQGTQQCFQNLDCSECSKLLCHLPFALKTVAGE